MLRPTAPASLLIRLRRAWRRSLQFRVVTLTMVCSTVLVGTFSIAIGNMITSGLVREKTAAAKAQVEAGSEYASTELRGLNADDPQFGAHLAQVAAELAKRGTGDQVQVVIIPAASNSVISAQSYPGDLNQPVPDELRAAVQSQQFVMQRLELDLDGSGPQLYLAYGEKLRLSAGLVLELYYFFPMTSEVAVAALVRSTLAATGTSLVLLLGLLAWLVTRMVVSPVRVAARTAQRLSAGLLDQRMEVHGEDDLAALAASFNQMAVNLQRHIQRLEEMSRLQRRFTSDVSHELRTPLTTVRMAAEYIFSEREQFDPTVARSAELLQVELDRFESLLTDLLEISRFDAGFAMLDAEAVDLVPTVRRVADRLVTLADRAGVQVDVHVPAEPVIAEVDLRRLERILRNLIGNAVEHGEGRPVEVWLAADDGAVAITVRDYGVGLKPGEEKLVFNRFWRADPSRARQTGGTGLGLSISLEDARLHGGWLEAWGAPGQGAQFRLTLPTRAGDRLVASPLRLVPGEVPGLAEFGPAKGFGPAEAMEPADGLRPLAESESVIGELRPAESTSTESTVNEPRSTVNESKPTVNDPRSTVEEPEGSRAS